MRQDDHGNRFAVAYFDERVSAEERLADFTSGDYPHHQHYWVELDEPVTYHDLACQAVAWISDEPRPGIIDVVLVDIESREWHFVDKVAIFGGSGPITRQSSFPMPVTLRVRVVEDGEALLVSTDPRGVESQDGENLFRVSSALIAD